MLVTVVIRGNIGLFLAILVCIIFICQYWFVFCNMVLSLQLSLLSAGFCVSVLVCAILCWFVVDITGLDSLMVV